MKDLRREYASHRLDEHAAANDAVTQFRVWFDEAVSANLIDVNAMSLATATAAGAPSVRTVLLKDVDARGFVFFTHYDSRKGRELHENPRASLLFFWAELERQIRITGTVTTLPAAESDAYFASRPIESQYAAWAATQSTVLASRESLDQAYAAVQQRFAGKPLVRPPTWGGFIVAPSQIEVWQGRPSRLHDRLLYSREHDGTWSRVRLAP
jgi:pyridoxamine 5'-phosphate oxidase